MEAGAINMKTQPTPTPAPRPPTPMTDANEQAFSALFTEAEKHPEYWKELHALSEDHARSIETKLAAARAEIVRLKKRIADDNKAYGCELRDPNGTIWDHATKLQAELARLTAELEAKGLHTCHEDCQRLECRQRREIEAIKAERDALAEDKERLDWLETQDCWMGLWGERDIQPKISAGGCYALKVRQAIDAARATATPSKPQ